MTTHVAVKKRLVARIQRGGYRHLEFSKTYAFAFLAIVYQLSTNFVVMLRLWIKTQLLHRKTHGGQNPTWWLPPSWIYITDTVVAFFNQFSSTLVGMLQLWIKTHLWRRKTPGCQNPTWWLTSVIALSVKILLKKNIKPCSANGAEVPHTSFDIYVAVPPILMRFEVFNPEISHGHNAYETRS